MKRKHFIRNAFALVGGAAILPTALEASSLGHDKSAISKALKNTNFKPLFDIDRGRVFMNNGTLGLSPKNVTQAYIKWLKRVNSTGNYHWNTGALIKKIENFIHATEKSVALTHNVTEGINLISSSIQIKPGDEIIISNHEHVGNAVPWLHRARLEKATIKVLDLGKSADETIENLKKIISNKTKLIAVPHIPCTTGQILPVKDICSIASKKGILTCIDGAHGPGMIPVNVEEMNCDFYISCGHKWMLGPKGVGFIYIKDERKEDLTPQHAGSMSYTGWYGRLDKIGLDEERFQPGRFTYGTQDHSCYFSFNEALKFQNQIGKMEIENYVKNTSAMVYEGLQSFGSKIEIVTPFAGDERGGMVSFKPKTVKYTDVVRKLADQKITVRQVPEHDLNLVRISTHIYNTQSDVKKLINALEGIIV